MSVPKYIVNSFKDISKLPEDDLSRVLQDNEEKLSQLPDEVILAIMVKMPVTNLANLCKSSARFNQLCKDPTLDSKFKELHDQINKDRLILFLEWAFVYSEPPASYIDLYRENDENPIVTVAKDNLKYSAFRGTQQTPDFTAHVMANRLVNSLKVEISKVNVWRRKLDTARSVQRYTKRGWFTVLHADTVVLDYPKFLQWISADKSRKRKLEHEISTLMFEGYG